MEFHTIFPQASVFDFSPNGPYLVTGDYDGSVSLWNNDDFSFVRQTDTIFWEAPTSIAVAPDGTFVAAGFEDGTLRLWNLPDMSLRAEILSLHNSEIRSVAISNDGHRIATGGEDGRIRLWDSTEFDQLAEGPGDARVRVKALHFSSDGRFTIFRSDTVLSGLMDAESGELVEIAGAIVADDILLSRTGMIIRLGPGPNESVGNLELRTSDDFRLIENVPSGLWGYTTAVAVSASGAHIVMGDNEGAIRLLSGSDLRSMDIEGIPPFTLGNVMQRGVFAVAFSPDGRLVVSASGEGILWVWDASELSLLGPPLRGFEGTAFDVSFSHDGRYIISGSWNGPIIWDLSLAGTDRLGLLCDRLNPVAPAEIAAIEAEYGLTLPPICTPEQRAMTLPPLYVPPSP